MKFVILLILVISILIPQAAGENFLNNTVRSPFLGLGYDGADKYDSNPVLYTYRTGEDEFGYTTFETRHKFPIEVTGPIIVTPPRIVGEKLKRYDSVIFIPSVRDHTLTWNCINRTELIKIPPWALLTS